MENLYKTTRKGLNILASPTKIKFFSHTEMPHQPSPNRALFARCKAGGMVLVITMLFLLVISFLALNLLNTGLLETKMSGYSKNKALAFYEAEKNLEHLEQEIIDRKIAGVEIDKITSNDGCCAIFYRVTASAEYKGAQSELQSTFVKITGTNPCDLKKDIKPGRQSFLIIH